MDQLLLLAQSRSFWHGLAVCAVSFTYLAIVIRHR
jgi:hypothetical protein